jgi:hypothetical protein
VTTFEINKALSAGRSRDRGVLPKLDELDGAPFVFEHSFGLQSLPSKDAAMALQGVKAEIGNQTHTNRWHQCWAEFLFDDLSPDHDGRESRLYLAVNDRRTKFDDFSGSCVKILASS